VSRIVVTGMGAVSPFGIGVERLWEALCRGECGITDITRFPVKDFPYTRGGEVRDFRMDPGLAPAGEPVDLASQFMLTAAGEAFREAGWADASPFPDGTGVVLSTNFGGILSGEAVMEDLLGKGQAPAGAFSESLFQHAADRVARRWRLGGPVSVLSLSCASGTAAIGYGMDLIRHGHAKAVLTGGYDALSRFCWSGLSALRTMSKDAVRPFDKNRNGTIFSEGAAALLLEDEEQALSRGARILAVVEGYGVNNNAFHITAPAKEGAGSAAVMRLALQDARLRPEDIDHINAHGTGTKPNDVTETQAIKAVFGPHARTMPITSIKSMIGHMMGAAGSIEAIASVLTIRDGIIPPTTHYQDPDPECDLPCVTNVKKEMPVRTVLSNSAGIGGCNAAVVFRRGGVA
jgi:3-oxoacyl-[acyl-carrier-protein] synthase II